MEFILQNYLQKLGELERLLEGDFEKITALAQDVQQKQTSSLVIGRLIHQLQFHDIIRQKIQHVAHFGRLLEQEIKLHQQQAGQETVLTGLIELSMALLQYAQLEYEDARVDIAMVLKKANVTTELSLEFYHTFSQQLQELIQMLATLHMRLNLPPIDTTKTKSIDELKKIAQVFCMQSEREIFRSLFDGQTFPGDPFEEREDKEGSDDIELF